MATFLYFAYGSNLCKRRLQINCPSAELVCFAELRDYRLRFFNLRGIQSDWHGAAATLKQENGAITWGAVWRISHDHSDNLDRQEGIIEGATSYCPYKRVMVEVVGGVGKEIIACRSYEMTDQSSDLEGLPSPHYLQVITCGAEEVGLPIAYQQKLRALPRNNYQGDVATFSQLFSCPPSSMTESFLYFGYASNMSKKRINVSCPSAELVCAAKLNGYGIKFVEFRNMESRWCGAVACAVESPGEVVWGAVWRISSEDGAFLDKQEGSDINLLRRKPVSVYTASGECISCYLYQAVDQSDDLEGLPSPQYLNVIITGAEEVGLPEDYLSHLKQLPHNGYSGDVELPDTP